MKKNLYVYNSGVLSRKDNTLRFSNNDVKQDYPVANVDSIYIFGKENINTDFIDFCSKNDINIHFFNYYGFYNGSFISKNKYVSGSLIIKQVEFYLDSEKRLYLAQQFVIGALKAMVRNLQYYKNKGIDFNLEINMLKSYEIKILQSNNISQLMGEEGNINKLYYSCWNRLIKQPINFDKRIKHPPNNMINTLISFVNSLVYTLVLSEIYKTELNPTISYLHTCCEKRYSLSLDIAEIFKKLIGDRLIFFLLNKNIINESCFNKKLGYLQIDEKASKKILEYFDKRMLTTIFHRDLKKEVSYRYLIRLECYKLIKHFFCEKKYTSFEMWW